MHEWFKYTYDQGCINARIVLKQIEQIVILYVMEVT